MHIDQNSNQIIYVSLLLLPPTFRIVSKFRCEHLLNYLGINSAVVSRSSKGGGVKTQEEDVLCNLIRFKFLSANFLLLCAYQSGYIPTARKDQKNKAKRNLPYGGCGWRQMMRLSTIGGEIVWFRVQRRCLQTDDGRCRNPKQEKHQNSFHMMCQLECVQQIV